MKRTFLCVMLCCILSNGCVSTSQRLKSLPEESNKQDVVEILGKSYEVYYQSEDPGAKITEVWDYRLFPDKGRYDRFQRSLDRFVGIVGSFGVALLYPYDRGKEIYRLYFKGDQLLKWEPVSGGLSEVIPRSRSID